MKKERNKAIPAAYLFLEKEGRYLLARRANTGYEDGSYQVPSGHVEEGELPSEAAIREAKEEVGVEVSPEDIELFFVSYRPKHDDTDDYADFYFKTSKWKGDVRNMEPRKCDDLKWASLDALPENMTLHVREAFGALHGGVFYREIGLEELKREGLYKL
ncbi:MAG: NUDIX domain-containing protein [Candidatus Taylorbacteria bacterium]|nr:NUDIX domain-containing protein [Candidatus Taylorbacteria bacterium]